MTYKEIRDIISNFPVDSRTEKLLHSSVISPLFPGTFNYCLNEDFIYDRYGSYLDIPDPIFFTKTQPAIRDSDFEDFYLTKGNEDKNHLANFDIATIAGGKIDKRDNYQDFIQSSVKSTYDLLTNYFGLDKNKIFITYFGGGSVKEVSKNKFDLDFDLPPDLITKNLFIENGIPESNITPISTRENFLMINFTIGFGPWGYRNEIFYEMPDGSLLDIATIECLLWRPIFDKSENKFSNLIEWENCFVIDGFGIERTLMAINHYDFVQQCDHIYPLFLKVKELINGDYNQTRLVTECLRVIHRVCADSKGKGWDALSSSRREKIKKYISLLPNWDEGILTEIFNSNSSLYGFHYPELESSVELTTQTIIDYKKRIGRIKLRHRKSEHSTLLEEGI